MALTAEGRALTDAHRREQVGIGANARIVGRSLWANLDVDRLDASTPAWLEANVSAAARYHRDSSSAAARYVQRYRVAELGVGVEPIEYPSFDADAARRELLLAGPVRVKLLAKGGMDGRSAHAAALTKYAGILGRSSMMGGRKLIDGTAGADTRAVGWRRVSDGDPCSFCAMLCSRGPVYRSGASSGTDDGVLHDNKSGLRFHGHCGCTAEIVYGEWTPNEAEQHYIDLYEDAAQKATAVNGVRTQETVLWRMRRDGDLRDSAARRAVTP
jgi:hypothetical protein